MRLRTRRGTARMVALLALGTVPTGARGESSSRGSDVPSADTAAVVLARVFEAYGGLDRIQEVRSLRQEGLVIATDGGHGNTVRIARCPAALSLLVEYPDRREIRIVEEEGAWQGSSPSSLSQASAPMRSAMVLQAGRTCLPGILALHQQGIVVEESTDVFTVLAFDVEPGLRLRAFVSNETALVLRSESILGMGGGSMTFASDYADYREVSGVQFPFREEAFAGGTHTASIRLESVEVNPEGERARLPVSGGFR